MNVINEYEKMCGSVKEGLDSVSPLLICTAVQRLCVLVCQACINIPQTDCDHHVSTLLFSSQLPWKSAIFAGKDSYGWLFDVLSSSFPLADNWVPWIPAGEDSLPFPVSCSLLCLPLFT